MPGVELRMKSGSGVCNICKYLLFYQRALVGWFQDCLFILPPLLELKLLPGLYCITCSDVKIHSFKHGTITRYGDKTLLETESKLLQLQHQREAALRRFYCNSAQCELGDI